MKGDNLRKRNHEDKVFSRNEKRTEEIVQLEKFIGKEYTYNETIKLLNKNEQSWVNYRNDVFRKRKERLANKAKKEANTKEMK